MPAATAERRASTFVVEVRYREPGYEARHGERAEPYRFRYRIDAHDPAAATAIALREFHDITARSSVGWARVIVDVVATPVGS